VTERQLRSRARPAILSRPRFVAWAIIRSRLSWAYEQIGDLFDRDHTTISSGCKQVDIRADDVRAICQRLDACDRERLGKGPFGLADTLCALATVA
jgi:chromosomal replication initiation ATPase DnaA